ncbi:MAG: hypothetical protein HC877_20470 [Thioploca sp.]|nr:hypothetical protein [Thioploca sp.]
MKPTIGNINQGWFRVATPTLQRLTDLNQRIYFRNAASRAGILSRRLLKESFPIPVNKISNFCFGYIVEM